MSFPEIVTATFAVIGFLGVCLVVGGLLSLRD